VSIYQLIDQKLLDHQLEISRLEARLRNYRGLKSEPEVRREESLLRAVKSWRLKGFEHFGYREPPPLLTLFPKGKRYPRKVMPGATTDWDFSSTNWLLDTGIYVSSPSSIRFGVVTACYALCKYAGTTNLPQGRLATWLRSTLGGAKWRIYWRNQAAVGSSNVNDTYLYALPPTATSTWYLYEMIGGSTNILTSGTSYLTGNFSLNTWYKLRATWWVSDSQLAMRLERLNATWEKVVADYVDTTPTGGATVNRPGIGRFAESSGYLHFDDTEIWGP